MTIPLIDNDNDKITEFSKKEEENILYKHNYDDTCRNIEKENSENMYVYKKEDETGKRSGYATQDEILSNDPFRIFYYPTDGYKEKAEWFMGLVADIVGTYHIRRIHYMTLGSVRPDGKIYQNTKGHQQYLQAASVYARYLGMVDWDMVVDHKNIGVVEETPYYVQVENGELVYRDIIETDLSNTNDLIKEEIENVNDTIDFGNGKIEFNRQNRQPYHIEIWCEKSTINDVLLPFVRTYGATLVVASGQFSITLIKECYERIKDLNKPVVIFYLRDFDPAGDTMPIAGGRKLEWFVRGKDKDNVSTSNEVRLIDVALTYEQCIKYELPRQPMSSKATKYKKKFEELYGEGQTELDSFVALKADEFKKLLDDNIKKYYDKELDEKIIDHNIEEQKRFDIFKKDLINKIIDIDLNDENKEDGKMLEIELEKYNKKIRELNDIGDSINELIKSAIEKLDSIELEFNAKDPPMSILVTQEDDSVYTLDTRRTYNEQMKIYHLIQDKLEKMRKDIEKRGGVIKRKEKKIKKIEDNFENIDNFDDFDEIDS